MTHADIIKRWPSLSAFAEDLGIKYGTAKAMRRRGSIPVNRWTDVIARAADRQIAGVTLVTLVNSAAPVPVAPLPTSEARTA